MPRLIEWLPEPVAEGLRAWRADLRDRRDWASYQRRPQVPPPHVVKVRALLDHARRFGTRVLIETGTFEGETPRKCRAAFDRIFTLELDPGYARRAAHRLRHHRNIEVLEGDSVTRLPELLARVREPALFWLDGHYSGGLTARGAKDTPLLEELETITRHGVAGHVVLIDDARCLGAGDYPTLDALERILRAVPGIERVEVAEDIVRATPRARDGA
jgi:hypothetical protein